MLRDEEEKPINNTLVFWEDRHSKSLIHASLFERIGFIRKVKFKKKIQGVYNFKSLTNSHVYCYLSSHKKLGSYWTRSYIFSIRNSSIYRCNRNRGSHFIIQYWKKISDWPYSALHFYIMLCIYDCCYFCICGR